MRKSRSPHGVSTEAHIRPGYRRRIVVETIEGAVVAMLEDDIHCLSVTLRHDGIRVTAIEPVFERAPWTTCPGAMAKLIDTFQGKPITEVNARQDKRQNCTHLHDMAVLAAAHAHTPGHTVFDIAASDPIEGERLLEILCDGATIHAWTERDGVLAEPQELMGKTLFELRRWIGELPEPQREAARLLQWGSMVAHGRTMPMEEQSVASDLPPSCYTFQPERAVHAVRNGERFDFSESTRVPLAGFADDVIARL